MTYWRVLAKENVYNASSMCFGQWFLICRMRDGLPCYAACNDELMD